MLHKQTPGLPCPTERAEILANVRGVLAGYSLIAALEGERRAERERDERKAAEFEAIGQRRG